MNTRKKLIEYLVFILPMLLAAVCLLLALAGGNQAQRPLPMPQELVGEYSYDGETWLPLTENAEISALEGDIILRGHFLREMQEGWQLDFYRNHIGVAVYINGERIYADSVSANREISARNFSSMCARQWSYINCPHISTQDEVEIHLHNPHRFGNKAAYREFLDTLCADTPGLNLLQKNLEPYGAPSRILGGLLIIAAMMLLGAALAAAVARVGIGALLLKLALTIFFAGGFIVFDAVDVSFWSELNILNTYAVQLCIMLAGFCMAALAGESLTGGRRKAADIALCVSAAVNSVLIVISLSGAAVIYDTLPVWSLFQLLLCPFMVLCCFMELRQGSGTTAVLSAAILVFAAIPADIVGLGGNIVWRSPCSKLAFVVLLAVHVIAGAREMIKNHRASVRAERLEKELEDSRIAIMLSQIKPHFLYNVLNTIYHLYRKEPETAQEAVSSFAEYLRCNMLSIEKSEPIPFSEEYRHIQTYLSLEQIRFRGRLDVVYDVEESDFRLPPLTVEPLVENAVKHGVTKKRGGGTVTISTRKTKDGYTVTVADTGLGFEPERYLEDGKPHVGIRNVRQRLQNMVGGELSITSTQDGTLAVVKIPAKEAERTR